ncbi:MAG: hypothetical protein Q4A18_04335 [Rikenellaceae bacterium]|nr:hypothetical protein [Rikenellaceae bacterium]
MQKDWLLPYGFKRVGWVLLAIAVPIAIWAAAIGFNYQQVALLRDLQLVENPLINNHIILWLWLGMLFVACSREKIEDEMIARIRLNALLVALYIQAVLIIVATFAFNSLDFLNIMIYNLVSYPMIFVIAYRAMLWRARKEAEDEE